MKLPFYIVFLLVLMAMIVHADDMMLMTFVAEHHEPVALVDIQRVIADVPPREGPYQYQLVDRQGSVLAEGSFSFTGAMLYDTLKGKEFAGGYLERDSFEFSALFPLLGGIQRVLILKEGKLIFQEDIAHHPRYLEALSPQGADLPTNCTTIQSNGDPGQKLDITFLAHGYAESERQRFLNDMRESKDYLFSLAPFNSHIGRINVHYVNQTLDLGCYAGCGAPQAICCSEARVWAAAAQCPWTWGTDKIVVLTNGLPYGGSAAAGGNQAVASNARYLREVVAHEFGHAFGVLWDEYDYGYSGPQQVPMYLVNCDNQPCNRWSHIPGTGCISICGYNNQFRSVQDSLMRTITSSDYGIVSVTNMTWRLGQFNGEPQINSTPVINATTGRSYAYQVTAADPNNDPLVFAFARNPRTMAINQNTGLITWDPVVSESRAPVVNVTVSDRRGGSASQFYLIRLL